jgi:hypothetical protein
MNNINNLPASFHNDQNSLPLEQRREASQSSDESPISGHVADERFVYMSHIRNEGFKIPSKERLRNLIQRIQDFCNWIIDFFQRTLISVIGVLQTVKLYKWIKIDGSLFKGPIVGLDFSRTSIENLHQHVTVVCNGGSACRNCRELNEVTHHVTHLAYANTVSVH